jgi:hypothetical protein
MAQEKHLTENVGEIKDYITRVEEKIAENSEQDNQTTEELQELKRRFLLIFDRQNEVNIGKRNVNCLSCATQPLNEIFTANDGKVYKGRLTDVSKKQAP